MINLRSLRESAIDYWKESKGLFLLQVLIFIIVSTLITLKSISTGEFLSQNGIDALPKAFIIIAIVAVAIHQLIERTSRTQRLTTIIKGNHIFHMICIGFITAGYLWSDETSPNATFFYIYTSMYALMTVSFYYQFIQSIFSIREAKHLYPFIGSAAILGGISGGYIASLLVHLGGPELVLLYVFFMLSLSFFIYLLIFKKYDYEEEDTLTLKPEAGAGFQFFHILTNKHVKQLMIIIGLGVFISKMVDYQFNMMAHSYIQDSVKLTAFFGYWFSTINIVGFLIQLFMTKRLMNRLGMTKSILLMPGLLMVCLVAFLIFPVLAVAIIMKVIDGSLKQSIYKTATDIYYMPLSDALRNKAKTLSDVVVDSLATGMAGLLIFGFINVIDINLGLFNVGLLVVTAIWVVVILRSKSSYKMALSEMLKEDIEDFPTSGEKKPQIHQSPSTFSEVVRAIENAIYREKSDILMEFIQKSERADKLTLLDELCASSNIQVTKAAWELRLKNLNYKALEKEFSIRGFKDKVIIVSALVSRYHMKPSRSLKARIVRFWDTIALKSLTQFSPDEQLVENIISEVTYIISQMKFSHQYVFVEHILNSHFSSSQQASILEGIARSSNAQMYSLLEDADILKENLTNYLATLASFPRILLNKLQNSSANEIVQILPACVHIEHQKCINLLIKFLDHPSNKVRKVTLKTLNECRRRYPHLYYQDEKHKKRLKREIRLLKKLYAFRVAVETHDIPESTSRLLRRRIKHDIKKCVVRVFIYLGLITKMPNLDLVYRLYTSGQHDKGLDFLDSVLNYKLRRSILPIVELVAKGDLDIENLKKLQIPLPKVKQVLSFFKSPEMSQKNLTVRKSA